MTEIKHTPDVGAPDPELNTSPIAEENDDESEVLRQEVPGEPVWECHSEEAFNAAVCQAEYLWETAARSGRRSVVMNYAGYPPTTDKAVFIEWLFQPAKSYFDLAAATVYHNCPDLNTTDPITLTPAKDWANLPPSAQPPFISSSTACRTATRGAVSVQGAFSALP